MTHYPARFSDHWPLLPYAELAHTVDYIRRLVQVGGKYTLDQTFEPCWGNIVLDVTPRGLSTPTLRLAGTTFRVHFDLLGSRVVLETSNGTRTIPLRTQSIADFYDHFVSTAAGVGIPAPRTAIATEIPGATALDLDREVRHWDPRAAQLVWSGFDNAADALERWQAPYRGHRPRTGVMWGGFDLSATRYRGAALVPPMDRPAFMQHGMNEEEVALGFTFGSPDSPTASMYAYIAPQPAGMDARWWGTPGATWVPTAGLVVLPWPDVIAADDPTAAIIGFGDAVYTAAVELAGWPADLTGPRRDGWHASHHAPSDLS